jgi:hypothetical protein
LREKVREWGISSKKLNEWFISLFSQRSGFFMQCFFELNLEMNLSPPSNGS